MKYKNLFNIMGLAIVAALTFTACSQDELGTEEKTVTKAVERDADGMYTYTMRFDCETPVFDANETRATTSWANNSKIYLKFGNIAGTATYNSSTKVWTVKSNSSLSITNNETECDCFYFEGNPTLTSLSYKNPVYGGKGKYTHPTSSDIFVKGKLQPINWRLKFEGGSVTLKGTESEIYYLSSFNSSTCEFNQPSQFGENTTLSNGEYIYGVFAQNATEATISVKTDQDNPYTRKLQTSNLAAGESGKLTRPTKTNYQSLGWSTNTTPPGPGPDDQGIDPNATIAVDYLVAFTDGMVTDWKFGSTATSFAYVGYTKAGADSKTDDQLYEELSKNEFYGQAKMENLFRNTSDTYYKTNSDYYVIAVARNSEGVRGPILRYPFKTLSTSLPYAQISNIDYDKSTKKKWTFDIAMKNSAKGYYLVTNVNEDVFNDDWHWLAYNTHYWATTKQIELHDWTSVATTLNSGTCNVISICTWGVGNNNSIGNCNVAYGSVNSSARPTVKTSTSQYGTMSKDTLKKQMENVNVYYVK